MKKFFEGHKRDIIIIGALFFIALIVRVSYIAELDPPTRPLSGDSYWYDFGALGFQKIVSNPGVYGAKLMSNSFSDEERKELGINNDMQGFFRAPLVSVFFAVTYALFGGDNFRSVFVLQAILSSVTCVLVYLLSVTLFRRRILGVISAGMVIFYTSFIIYDGRLLTECLATFTLVFSCVVYYTSLSAKSPRIFFILGFILFLLLLTKAAFKLIILIFFMSLIVSKIKLKKERVTFLAIGFAVGIIPWLLFTHHLTGSALLGTSSKFGSDMLVRANYPPTEGYGIDSPGFVHNKEMRDAFLKGQMEGWDANRSYTQSILNTITTYPLRWIVLRVSHFSNLWFYPAHKMPLKTAFFTLPNQVHFHQLLIILGVIGLSLSLVNWRLSLPFYLFFGYFSALFGLPEHRFNMPAMVILSVYASFAAVTFLRIVIGIFQDVRENGRKSFVKYRNVVAVFVSVCGFALIAVTLNVAVFASLLRGVSPQILLGLSLFLKSVALLSVLSLLYKLLLPTLRKRMAFICALVPISLFTFGLIGCTLNNRNWREWKVALKSPDEKVIQEITLPSNLDLGKFENPVLKVDMLGGLGKGYDVVIHINGAEIRRYIKGLQSDNIKFENNVHPEIFQTTAESFNEHYSTNVYGEEDFRQWFSIPFDMSLIDPAKPLRVEIHLEGEIDHKKNYIYIFGDHGPPEGNVFEGPSFAHTPFETSRWKFWAFLADREKADNRLHKVTPLESVSTVSSFYDGRRLRYDDLSDERGRQSGQYRIRLQLKYKGGYYIRTDDSGKQKVLWTVPQGEDTPVPQDYLVGRIQRQADVYFSGYEIF